MTLGPTVQLLDAYFVCSPHESGSYSLSILSSTGLEFSQVPVSEAAKLRHYHHATDTAAVALTTAVNGSYRVLKNLEFSAGFQVHFKQYSDL